VSTGKQFTDEEAQRLRELLKADDRVKWFWASIRTWALWLAAVASAMHWGWAALTDIFTSFFRH
jgi:hypothetical protein